VSSKFFGQYFELLQKEITMTERKMIQERERYWGEMEGNIADVIASLQAEVARGAVRLEKEQEYDYGDCSCSRGYTVWYLVLERPETDAEIAKRLKAAEKAKAARAAQKVKEAAEKRAAKAAKEKEERAQLARLLEKYGEG
jgi:hypothetical protein